MRNINCVVISGRLVADPVMRATSKGLKVAGFRIASDRLYADKKEVVFIDVSVFGKTAEHVEKYMHKGAPVLVRGKLELNEWKTKEGEPRKTYQILGDEVIFLPSSRRNAPNGPTVEGEILPPGLGASEPEDAYGF